MDLNPSTTAFISVFTFNHNNKTININISIRKLIKVLIQERNFKDKEFHTETSLKSIEENLNKFWSKPKNIIKNILGDLKPRIDLTKLKRDKDSDKLKINKRLIQLSQITLNISLDLGNSF